MDVELSTTSFLQTVLNKTPTKFIKKNLVFVYDS